MKFLSYLQAEQALFPHFSAIVESFSTILHPILSAFVKNSSSRVFKSLLIIFEMIWARMRLRICSTHFTVRSTIALSARDSTLNQIPLLTALDLTFIRPCLVSTDLPLSPHSILPSTRGTSIKNYRTHNHIKVYFPILM